MKTYQVIYAAFIFTALTCCTQNLLAQTSGARRLSTNEAGPKGQIMVYGSLDYSKVKSPEGNNVSVGSAPIGVGYFFNNNDLIGVNFAFSRNINNGVTNNISNETGLWYSPSVMLGKYFVLIGQVDAHYVWGKQAMLGNASMNPFNGFRLRAYPLIGVLVGSGWALKFKFGELSTLQTKNKQGDWTKTTIAGLSGSTFGVGISKNFDFRKKSHSHDS